MSKKSHAAPGRQWNQKRSPARDARLTAVFNQALAHHLAGRLVEAEAGYREVLGAQARHFDALHLLGVIFQQRGDHEAAIRLIDEALAINAGVAAAHNNRAVALLDLKRFGEALASCDRAISLTPGYAEALRNRGVALKGLARIDEALASLDRAIALNPGYVEALIDRGIVLHRLGRDQDALASFDRALELRPGSADALANRGNLLLDLTRIDEALASYDRALAIKPDPRCHSNRIFALNFDPKATAADQQAERARWNALHARQLALPSGTRPIDRDPDRRLRIGYVSGHFRHQAATYAFGGVMTQHDKKQFEVICYSDTLFEDEVTLRLRESADVWRGIAGLSDAAVAELIQADGIDILVDLVGHMEGNRLLVFARKPAPVQVTAWGEPTGTGLTAMDYLLADPTLLPLGERGLLSEGVIDLPNFLCYWRPDSLPEPGPLPALAEGHVTFGSFNRAAKIQDPVLRSWAAILRRLPDAHLALRINHPLGDAAGRTRIDEILAEENIDLDRVSVFRRGDRLGHFAGYRRIDIALDPFPHGGGMTTLDALWMGVPVVTCAGRTISSRLAAASLTALGLTDFIAGDVDSYVELAVAKASDRDALSALRAGLRRRVGNSAVGDCPRYTRAVEAAYREMWRHRAGA